MDAFDRNKYNELAYVQSILSNAVIVSYGFITAIEFDSVIVTLSVSGSLTAERAKCTFMNLGSELFNINLKPAVGMRVIVLSPNKSAPGMFDSIEQISINEGQDYILTGSPAVYSTQNSICIPMVKASVQAMNALIVDNGTISAEVKLSLIARIQSSVEIDLLSDSNIELHPGTKHFRGCYGDMEQTFGFLQGIGGAEKPGTYVYKETYGKFSSVEKNYESGAVINVGKTFEKPFLENKGAAVDSVAPVTLVFGKNAPVNFTASAPVTLNLSDTTPVTLNFGGTAVSIKVDKTTGLDIKVTGSAPVKIMAATGLVKLGNSVDTLKGILEGLADLIDGLTTIGPNVVPGAPYTAATSPAAKALIVTLKSKIGTIFE